MKQKFSDERIRQETNRVYRSGFTFLSLLILLDIIVKLSSWELENNFITFFLTVGIEIIILVGVFLTTSFILAKKGIALGAYDLMEGSFPKKRYARICTIIGLIFGLTTIIRMIYFGRSAFYLIYDILFGILFFLVVALITFMSFYLFFYLLFKYAKHCAKEILRNDIK